MIKALPLNKRHTGCPFCNYHGCIVARDNYGILGHVIWSIKLAYRNAKMSAGRKIKSLTALDYSKIDDVEVGGIDPRDYPDFSDAYIVSATYKGREMTEAELDKLNDDADYIYRAVEDCLS